MHGKAAKRVRDGEEKQAVPVERRTYRAEGADPVFFSFDMGEHAEERYGQVIRACCPGGTEVGGDQQAVAADAAWDSSARQASADMS